MRKETNRGTLIGAAFLMATSAIGPGFLTQTVPCSRARSARASGL